MTHNASTLDSQAWSISAKLVEMDSGRFTFCKFGDKVLGDSLQLLGVNGEKLFESLNLLHKILWHIGHRT
jgi:hypothetical protein